MLAIWNFAHILTAVVFISWWGLEVRMRIFAKWWCHTLGLHFRLCRAVARHYIYIFFIYFLSWCKLCKQIDNLINNRARALVCTRFHQCHVSYPCFTVIWSCSGDRIAIPQQIKTKLRAPRCLNNISFSARAQCPSTGTESECGLRFPSPPITFHWWGNNTGNKLSKILLQGSEYNTCPNTFFSNISTAWYTKYSNQNKTQPHKKHFKRMQTFDGGCSLLSGCRDKTW